MFGSFVFLQLMIPIGNGFPVGGPLAISTLTALSLESCQKAISFAAPLFQKNTVKLRNHWSVTEL